MLVCLPVRSTEQSLARSGVIILECVLMSGLQRTWTESKAIVGSFLECLPPRVAEHYLARIDQCACDKTFAVFRFQISDLQENNFLLSEIWLSGMMPV